MGNPTKRIGKNRDTDQLFSKYATDQHLCFHYTNMQSLFYFLKKYRKFQASNNFLELSRPVCIGPVRKPHCLFSHDAANIYFDRTKN